MFKRSRYKDHLTTHFFLVTVIKTSYSYITEIEIEISQGQTSFYPTKDHKYGIIDICLIKNVVTIIL